MALHLALRLRGHARFALLAGSAIGALSLSACGDDGAGTGGGDSAAASTGTAGDCAGVIENGACVPKCDPATCTAGNICAGNRCVLPCDGVDDCYAGSTCQDTTDDSGAAAKACLPSGKAPILGASCFFGTECAAWTVCPDGTACGASVCGGQPCTNNLCPDGTACTPQTCDAAACRAPRCYGAAPDAVQSPSASTFCTQDDCTQDSDCVQGMYCAKTRDWHQVCGREEDFGGIRMIEDEPCIDPADFTTDGKTFELGTITLLRNTCLPRTQCAPCETDLDCSAKAGQVCASVGGENRCLGQCNTINDCGIDTVCADDPAHAGMKVCAPEYGSSTGGGEFCAPCLNDLDCGAPDSPFVCDPVSILYDAFAPTTPSTGIPAQRGCFDLSLPDECTEDTDCPEAPDGVHRGECLGSAEFFSPGDGFYEHCFLPYNSFSSRFECW